MNVSLGYSNQACNGDMKFLQFLD